MQHQSRYAVALGALFALTGSAAQAFAAGPLGVWLDDSGRGAVEIKACGKGICGFVVAVKNASDTKGCGKQIIGDAQPVRSGLWDNGWIYSPEKRKNYDVELKPLADGNLRVVGYAGTKLFSRTMIWTPAPADIKRCDATDTAPASEAAVQAPATAPAKSAAQPAVVAAAPATDKNAQPAAKPINKPATPTVVETEDEAAPEIEASTDEPADEGNTGRRINIGDLDLDKFLTRSAEGKCKLDLPWVKVKFDCNKR